MNMNSFSQTDFQNPDSFFRPAYLWLWNSKLSEDEILSQLRELNSVGAKGVWIIPLPKDFRPESMPTDMMPDYLSLEYLELFSRMVQEMKRLDMRLWLYDDGGWPSGGVCGRIVKENPHLIQKTLKRSEIRPSLGDVVKIPAVCLSGFLFEGDYLIKKASPGEELKIDIEDARIDVYSVESDLGYYLQRPLYPDLLNPESTRLFIQKTHEEYGKYIGEHFGTAVSLIITDDVKVTWMPWTDDIIDGFYKDKGYNINDNLPSLFQGIKKWDMQVRIDYYDWWTKRFASAYFGQIHDWCVKHNLPFAGHLGAEEDILGARIHGHGHVLRNFRHFDIPGVDCVSRQIYPVIKKDEEGFLPEEKSIVSSGGVFNFNDLAGQWESEVLNSLFPKYATSVSHQEGRRFSWIELFSCSGSGLTIEQMKWITDFSFVRGMNLIAPCEIYLSTKDFYMAAMRPMFFPLNPLWKYLEQYNDYVSRMSYLLSLGKPVVNAAVYYPIRDIWAGDIDTIKAVKKSFEALSSLLFDNRCDFDYIDDDMLEREDTVVIDGKLKAGEMEYDTVYISNCEWMSVESKEKLQLLATAGGRVICFDNGSKPGEQKNFKTVDLRDLMHSLQPLVLVEPASARIRVCKRRYENGNMYFITNEDVEEVNCLVSLTESLQPFRIDAETGACWKVEGGSYLAGAWSLPLNLKFAGSCVLYFSNEEMQQAPRSFIATQGKSGFVQSINSGWECRKIRSYRIGDHDFEMEEIQNDPFVPINLGDWAGALGKDFSGDVEYKCSFGCRPGNAEKANELDLGIVSCACEVILNGKNLGKRVWQPYSFSINGLVNEGMNELRVIVTNTMANQYVSAKMEDRWPETVTGFYHKICLSLEADSTKSGLYGPVKIAYL